MRAALISTLKWLATKPRAADGLRPMDLRDLCLAGYATVVQLPSPWEKNRGELIDHLEITPAGRARLQQEK